VTDAAQFHCLPSLPLWGSCFALLSLYYDAQVYYAAAWLLNGGVYFFLTDVVGLSDASYK
jgi:hypothetical protein